ncbi:hypothetical protein BGZ99_006458 [Dissophora globulifera]|uniref:PH domain-containing protein n=1 Tax=Dissophora globulifera TaxID=979702 RepID=A0A9P6RES5_9FUNG|nr:hypothetical protein BGZ99_006458 [Dissophora globulifera]
MFLDFRDKDLLTNAQTDPKIDTAGASVIPIHVRYVTKDFWVQVDIPLDMPVHEARDLILAKCRLTSPPSQVLHSTPPPPLPLSTLAPSLLPSSTVSEVTLTNPGRFKRSSQEQTPVFWNNSDQRQDIDNRSRKGGHHYLDADSSSTFEGSSVRTDVSDNNNLTPFRGRRLAYGGVGGDDESFNDQESIGDDEAELQAEELITMAEDDVFLLQPQTPQTRSRVSSGSCTLSDSSLQELHTVGIMSPARSSREGSQHSPWSSDTSEHENTVLNQEQLNRLISYSSLHKGSSGNSYGSPLGDGRGGAGSKDLGGAMRFSRMSSWTRSRQNSDHHTRYMGREVLDHGGVLEDSLGGGTEPKTEPRKSECMAWKACFGLFWLAAGHWLDDSRLVSSYQLQPHCLLELQLRNNYIQLPPPGTSLSYYDHYAEGVLYKMSKKSSAKTGTWKERWVVLQGTKLFLYHKRKDTTKKAIELGMPLSVVTTVLPHTPRQGFKLACSSSPLPISTTILTLTISSDPAAPKVCFRATSESELSHWARIFSSLNFMPLQAPPPPPPPPLFDRNCMTGSPVAPLIYVPPPLPPLPLEQPPPLPLTTALPTSRRDRHHSYTTTSRFAETGLNFSKPERKRCHTIQGAAAIPAYSNITNSTWSAINPVLISNAAVALSNLSQHTDESSDLAEDIMRWRRTDNAGNSNSCSDGTSILRRDGHDITANARNSQHHHSLSRHVSLSSGYRRFAMEAERRQRMTSDLDGQPHQLKNQPLVRMRSLGSQRGSYQPLIRDRHQPTKAIASTEPVSESTSIPHTNTSENNQGLLNLDPSSQALLRSSLEKSSAPLLYSGYVWLYIPNTPSSTSLSSSQSSCQKRMDHGGPSGSLTSSREATPLMSKSNSSTSISMNLRPTMKKSTPSGNRAANISITKASGRYVKCYVAINALGQFQWVEAKKDGQQQQRQQHQEEESGECQDATPSPHFGIQLNAKSSAEIDGEFFDGAHPAVPTKLNDKNIMTKKITTPIVQASVAYKLRLYFFCIRISLSALSEVAHELNASSTNDIQSNDHHQRVDDLLLTAQPPMNKSSLRVSNRFSTPLKHRSTASLSSANTFVHPAPTTTRVQSLSKTRTRSGPTAASRHFLDSATSNDNNAMSNDNNEHASKKTTAVWPSMHPMHERPLPASALTITPPPPKPIGRLVPKNFSVPPPAQKTETISNDTEPGSDKIPRSLLFKTQSLFAENRTRSAPPGSILQSPNSTVAANIMDQQSSLSRGLHTRTASTGLYTMTAPTGFHTRTASTGLYTRTVSTGLHTRTASTASLYQRPSELKNSFISTEDTTIHTESATANSQVLSLAQDLQRAMQKGHISLAAADNAADHPSTRVSLDMALNANLMNQNQQEQQQQQRQTLSQKLSLQEITAKKRAAHQQQQNSANVAAARLKLVGGAKACDEKSNTGAADSGRGSADGNNVNKEEISGASQTEKELAQKRLAAAAATLKILIQCPFFEQIETQDADGSRHVTLKGYTETEEAWKLLQSALEHFLDGPIKDQRSALPPEDTLIPSYHAPRLPEIRLSEKAQNFLKAKDRATAAAAAAVTTAVGPLPTPTTVATTMPSLDSAMLVASADLSRTSSCRSRSSSNPSATGIMRDVPATTATATATMKTGAVMTVPAGFHRHSMPLAGGIGYGLRKSFKPDLPTSHDSAIDSTNYTVAPTNLGYCKDEVDYAGYKSRRHRSCTTSAALSTHTPWLSSSAPQQQHLYHRHYHQQQQKQQQQQQQHSVLIGHQQHQRVGSGNLFRSTSVGHDRKHSGPMTRCGPMAQIKATGANLTKWLHFSGGGVEKGSHYSSSARYSALGSDISTRQ